MRIIPIERYDLAVPLPPRLTAIAGRHHPAPNPSWRRSSRLRHPTKSPRWCGQPPLTPAPAQRRFFCSATRNHHAPSRVNGHDCRTGTPPACGHWRRALCETRPPRRRWIRRDPRQGHPGTDPGPYQRAARDGNDPVAAATAIAFGFVYIHPFEDGNGRLHRWLIHHVLATAGYNPPGVQCGHSPADRWLSRRTRVVLRCHAATGRMACDRRQQRGRSERHG